MMEGYVGRTQRVMLVAAAAGTLAFGASKVASACNVYLAGAIGVKWTSIGGGSSYEGPCVDNEHDDGVGNGGWIETFQNGHINWVPGDSEAVAVHGFIDESWWARGGPEGYGQAYADESGFNGCPNCRMSTFYVQSAFMYTYLVYNPGDRFDNECIENDLHVCAVYGAIGAVWNSYNDGLDIAGPPRDEEFWSDATHRRQDFKNVYLTWNRNTLNVCVYDYSGTPIQGPPACAFGNN
jgi:uncharacterized protein with LGFP repeats